MKSLILLLFVATTAFAQQTVTIPAPDGVTITNKDGVWSCISPGAANLPAGLTFSGGLFTAPAISTAQLTLTGGTTYADGQYLTQITGSKITYVKYVPPTVSGTSVKFATVTVAASPKALAAGASYDFKYAPPSGHVIGVEPNTDPGNWLVDHWAGNIRMRNLSITPSVSPALTVTVAYQ